MIQKFCVFSIHQLPFPLKKHIFYAYASFFKIVPQRFEGCITAFVFQTGKIYLDFQTLKYLAGAPELIFIIKQNNKSYSDFIFTGYMPIYSQRSNLYSEIVYLSTLDLANGSLVFSIMKEICSSGSYPHFPKNKHFLAEYIFLKKKSWVSENVVRDFFIFSDRPDSGILPAPVPRLPPCNCGRWNRRNLYCAPTG